uniref:Tubulin-specific chaperone D n=1 Tax=Parastrongyloides trichosuri TaxID=131310 RepID=A0A0N4Z6R1_PARTI
MTEFGEAIGLTSDILLPEHEKLITDYFINTPSSFDDFKTYKLFFTRFMMYSDNSFLLDHALPKWVKTLILMIKLPKEGNDEIFDKKSIVSLYNLSLLIEICSYKNIIKFLPHEVEYLEKLLYSIENVKQVNLSDMDVHGRLRMSFIYRSLFTWLYIVAKNPFSLNRFESTNCKESISNRIIEVCDKNHCYDSICLKITIKIWSQLVTRADQIESRMKPTITMCLDKIIEYFIAMEDSRKINCYLGLLVGIFKEGPRQELSNIGVDVIDKLSFLMDFQVKDDNDITKILTTKLVQRIGLSFLKPRNVKWKYSRGFRSLENTLKARKNDNIIKEEEEEKDNEDIDEEDSLDCNEEQLQKLEIILATLLNGLRDPVSFVRNNSAKGLGRVTARLTKDFADDVVNGIFQGCFDDYDTISWHGGCLALAEMTYRGFLLPNRLGEMINILEKAIVWEEGNGIMRQNEAVRDAATFISWAIARTYSPELVKPYVQRLATHLVTVSLFDKELNVRRAASAAFQENVGRQGYFPSGIDIIQIIDYSSISRLSICYNDLCVKVAKFEGYLYPMLNHLVDIKVGHQLMKMNVYACEGLYHLVKLDVKYSGTIILQKLLQKLLTYDAEVQFKVMMAIESVVRSLLEENAFDCKNSPLTLEKVKEINEKFMKEASSGSRKKREIYIKSSLAYFIKICCDSTIEMDNEVYLKWLNLVENFAEQTNIELRELALISGKSLMKQLSIRNKNEIEERVEKKYLKYIREDKFMLTLNMAVLMISSLPSNFLTLQIVEELINFIQDPLRVKLMDSRVYALKCLKERFIESNLLEILPQKEIIECINFCINDFTIDPAKGDIARFIREEAIGTMISYISKAYNKLSEDDIKIFVGNLLIQSCGKNINARSTSGEGINKILTMKPIVTVPDRKSLEEVFIIKDLTFSEGFCYTTVYDTISKLLSNETYGSYIRYGLVMTSGYHNGTEADKINEIWLNYLESIDEDQKLVIIKELKEHLLKKNTSFRIKRSILEFLNTYITLECFDFLQYDLDSYKDFCEILKYCIYLNYLKTRPGSCKALSNKEYSAKLISNMIICNENSEMRKESLESLCHIFEGQNELICYEVAKKICECLILIDDEEIIKEDEKEEVIEMLSNTVWDSDNIEKRKIADHLRKIFKLT